MRLDVEYNIVVLVVSTRFVDAAGHNGKGWQDASRPTVKLKFENRFLAQRTRHLRQSHQQPHTPRHPP